MMIPFLDGEISEAGSLLHGTDYEWELAVFLKYICIYEDFYFFEVIAISSMGRKLRTPKIKSCTFHLLSQPDIP